MESSTTGKNFLSLYKLVRLYNSHNPIEMDALVQFTGNQNFETAHFVLLEHGQIQRSCFPLTSIAKVTGLKSC